MSEFLTGRHTKSIFNKQGYITLYDISKSNSNETARTELITSVAVTSFGKDRARSQKNLYEKLVKEKNKFGKILKKEKEKAKEMSLKIDEVNRKYKELVKVNKVLNKRNKEVPKKFSEMVIQNERLLKDTAIMHYNLGVFYTKNREYEKAIEEYKKVLDIRPNDANAYFNLGYIYAERLNDREEAIDCFRSFLRLAFESLSRILGSATW